MAAAADQDSYVVRWGVRSLGLGLFVTVFCLVGAALTWPSRSGAVIFGGFLLVGVMVLVQALLRIRRQEVAFAVDSRGVYFGEDNERRRPVAVPWPDIHAVVLFRRQPVDTDGSFTHHVGIVRDGRIVFERAIQGWRLDEQRFTAAMRRFGGGRPVERGGDRDRTG